MRSSSNIRATWGSFRPGQPIKPGHHQHGALIKPGHGLAESGAVGFRP
jgi:hypothetical protein